MTGQSERTSFIDRFLWALSRVVDVNFHRRQTSSHGAEFSFNQSTFSSSFIFKISKANPIEPVTEHFIYKIHLSQRRSLLVFVSMTKGFAIIRLKLRNLLIKVPAE